MSLVIVESLIYIQYNKPLQFPCNLLSSRRLCYFLFCDFFRPDQGCLTFEHLGLLVGIHFYRLNLSFSSTGASMLLRLDLFTIYQYLLDLYVFSIVLAFIKPNQHETCLIGCRIYCFSQVSIKLIRSVLSVVLWQLCLIYAFVAFCIAPRTYRLDLADLSLSASAIFATTRP